MRELSSLAEQIRAVRQAQRQFIGRWRLEQAIIGPRVLDKLAADMAAAHRELDESSDGLSDTGMCHIEGRDDYSGSRLWSM